MMIVYHVLRKIKHKSWAVFLFHCQIPPQQEKRQVPKLVALEWKYLVDTTPLFFRTHIILSFGIIVTLPSSWRGHRALKLSRKCGIIYLDIYVNMGTMHHRVESTYLTTTISKQDTASLQVREMLCLWQWAVTQVQSFCFSLAQVVHMVLRPEGGIRVFEGASTVLFKIIKVVFFRSFCFIANKKRSFPLRRAPSPIILYWS